MDLKKSALPLIMPALVPGMILTTVWLTIFIRNSSSFTLNMTEAFLLAGAAWGAISLGTFLFLCAGAFFSPRKSVAVVLGISCAMILQYHLYAEIFDTDSLFSELTADSLLLTACHILLLALPAAVALLQQERCFRQCSRISLILILMQAVTLIYTVCTVPRTGDNYDFKEYSFSEKEKFSFGTKENIIVLVVDCMGERILKEVLVSYPELQESFKDFTCFDRMISPLPRTMYAVPALLTGLDFPGAEKGVPEDEDHGAYLNFSCRANTSLLQLARKNKFRVEGYPFILQTISYAPEVIDNSKAVSQKIRKSSALKILEITQVRLIPSFLKPFFSDEDDAEILPFVKQGMSDGAEGLSYDQDFYRRLEKEFRIGSYEKVFKYLHIHGAHDPVTTDEELMPKKNLLRSRQLRGSLKIVELLLQKLKDHGIYHSSTIIITGDHTEKYTPEIAAFIKRPFERKKELLFNSVPCRISQISGTAAKIAGLDPQAPSLFDLSAVPGNIKDVRDNSRQFPRFTNWEKSEKIPRLFPEGFVQGNHLLQGKRIMIDLAGENSLQFAAKVTVTAENVLTAERYRTALIKEGPFRDILLPELTLPEGDYLITAAEEEYPPGSELPPAARVIPAWFRVKGKEVTALSQAPDLFEKAVSLDKKVSFHPFAPLKGIRFSPGCTVQWGNVLIPEKEKIFLKLPDPSAAYRVDIDCRHSAAAAGEAALLVNGQIKEKMLLTEQGTKHLVSVELTPGKDGIAEISLEYRFKKNRRQKIASLFRRSRIFSITVRKSPSPSPQLPGSSLPDGGRKN